MIDCGSFTRSDLVSAGFVGFESVGHLRASRCRDLPAGPGAYCVLRPVKGVPIFLPITTGGRFKGLDKTLPVEMLRPRWVGGSSVVYIGKASSLRSRLRQLVDYGGGKPVGHQGGYPLWQLPDSDSSLVAWMEHPGFTALENHLLTSFMATHAGRLPYANSVGVRGSLSVGPKGPCNCSVSIVWRAGMAATMGQARRC